MCCDQKWPIRCSRPYLMMSVGDTLYASVPNNVLMVTPIWVQSYWCGSAASQIGPVLFSPGKMYLYSMKIDETALKNMKTRSIFVLIISTGKASLYERRASCRTGDWCLACSSDFSLSFSVSAVVELNSYKQMWRIYYCTIVSRGVAPLLHISLTSTLASRCPYTVSIVAHSCTNVPCHPSKVEYPFSKFGKTYSCLQCTVHTYCTGTRPIS